MEQQQDTGHWSLVDFIEWRPFQGSINWHGVQSLEICHSEADKFVKLRLGYFLQSGPYQQKHVFIQLNANGGKIDKW